jgi:hypothetical protein
MIIVSANVTGNPRFSNGNSINERGFSMNAGILAARIVFWL